MITETKQIDYRPLYQMLTYKRPAGSKTEKQFVSNFIDTIPGITADSFGNRILTIGENPRTLFSAHTDTVHRKGGKQKILVDEIGGYIYKDTAKKDQDCLGADDATGIFIMLQLIAAKIPGLYIFHREEEIGGIGSSWIAEKTPHILDGIDRAIAFDRKSDHSVITHQCGDRCCSKEFAAALADQIGGNYAPDSTGVFTDTANYTDLVSECTNLSVGYDSEHTKNETQDLQTLDFLIPALIAVDWESLPTMRDHTAPTYNDHRSEYWGDWIETHETISDRGFEDYDQAYDLCLDDPDLAAALLYAAYNPQDDQIFDQEDPISDTVNDDRSLIWEYMKRIA
jgi:hypothetical protein